MVEQELSYRKQIARQLHTQYVEGIHRPKYYTVTLKSTFRVTQDHWKQNHWTDHTLLTISTSLNDLECSFLFAFYSNYGRICSRC